MNDLKTRTETVLRTHVAKELGLAADDLEVVRVEDGIATVSFGPACTHCAGGIMGLVMLVEAELKKRVPEIEIVEPAA
jgi:Fe-S cluster biogenesis protein NfuA